MPVFIFLFGYHAKHSPKRILYRWCIPYVFFQSAYLLYANVVLKTNVAFQFTTPYWLLWYMLMCIYCQLLLPLFDTADHRKQVLAIACAFVIALLIGFEDSVGYYMSLSRFFVFQPWFLLGYYCKKSGILQRLSRKPKSRFAMLFASAVVLACLAPCLDMIPKGLLYGSYSYEKCAGALWMRGLASVMSFSMILFLFVGMKPYLNRKLPFITHIGQNTWPIFLLHGFVVKAVPVYVPQLVSSPWRVILLSCGILVLTGNKLCNKAVGYACFSWLEKLPATALHKKSGSDKPTITSLCCGGNRHTIGPARFVISAGHSINDRFASEYYRPTVDVMLRITGKRIATPVCALARNDI